MATYKTQSGVLIEAVAQSEANKDAFMDSFVKKLPATHKYYKQMDHSSSVIADLQKKNPGKVGLFVTKDDGETDLDWYGPNEYVFYIDDEDEIKSTLVAKLDFDYIPALFRNKRAAQKAVG